MGAIWCIDPFSFLLPTLAHIFLDEEVHDLYIQLGLGSYAYTICSSTVMQLLEDQLDSSNGVFWLRSATLQVEIFARELAVALHVAPFAEELPHTLIRRFRTMSVTKVRMTSTREPHGHLPDRPRSTPHRKHPPVVKDGLAEGFLITRSPSSTSQSPQVDIVGSHSRIYAGDHSCSGNPNFHQQPEPEKQFELSEDRDSPSY